METIREHIELDVLQNIDFNNIEEFNDFLKDKINSEKEKLSEKYKNVDFCSFSFSYMYDYSCGEEYDRRPTLMLNFIRDETEKEAFRRESYLKQQQQQKEMKRIREAQAEEEMKRKEYEEFLRLKEKFENRSE